MFPSARPVECQCPPGNSREETVSWAFLPLPSAPPTSLAQALLLPAQLVCKGFNPVELLSILRVHHQDAVEVTVAHVSHNASWGAQRTELLPLAQPSTLSSPTPAEGRQNL